MRRGRGGIGGVTGDRPATERPGEVGAMLVDVGGPVKGSTTLAGRRARWGRRSGSGPTEVELPRQRLT